MQRSSGASSASLWTVKAARAPFADGLAWPAVVPPVIVRKADAEQIALVEPPFDFAVHQAQPCLDIASEEAGRDLVRLARSHQRVEPAVAPVLLVVHVEGRRSRGSA